MKEEDDALNYFNTFNLIKKDDQLGIKQPGLDLIFEPNFQFGSEQETLNDVFDDPFNQKNERQQFDIISPTNKLFYPQIKELKPEIPLINIDSVGNFNENSLNMNTNTNSVTNYFINVKQEENNTKSFLGQKTSGSKGKLELTLEEIELKKEKKLLMNRISAKKSRQKKKDYILNLEKEIDALKKEIGKKKKTQQKENKIKTELNSNDFGVLIKKEKELILTKETKGNNNNQKEYSELQRKVLKEMFIRQIQVLMPIKTKIFQEKFMKMESFDENDQIEKVLNKVNKNIET